MNHIQFVPGGIDASNAFSTAWEMIKAQYGLYLGVALLAYVFISCIPCANVFLMGPVMGGVAFFVMRDLRGEPIDFGMMFKGFEKFVPLMVIGLIQSIPGIIAQILQFVGRAAEIGMSGRGGRDFEFFQSSSGPSPYLAGGMLVVIIVVAAAFMIFSLIWWAGFFFAIPLAMEHDLGPADAIKLSFRAAFSNLGGMILVLLCSIGVVLLGLLLICLGLFFISIPVLFVANVVIYRQVFPYTGANNFNMSPPPPTEYSFSTQPTQY